LGESPQPLPAASREQFYVSASRGRQGVSIYTDNKSRMIEAVRKDDDHHKPPNWSLTTANVALQNGFAARTW